MTCHLKSARGIWLYSRYSKESGEPGRNRTRSQRAERRGGVTDDFREMLLRPKGGVVSPEGIEPSTYRLRVPPEDEE